jgi:uncharacterized phage-associated protein
MPYETRVVVNSLLQRGFREKRTDMTPMKIQKLLFYLNGWQLAVTGKPAILGSFEAWKYGPVVPSIYRELKRYGAEPITEYLKEYDPESESMKPFVVADSESEFQEILDLTWQKYAGIDPLRLSAMTHAPNTPWAMARKRGDTVIDNDTIKNYFIGLARTTPASHRGTVTRLGT